MTVTPVSDCTCPHGERPLGVLHGVNMGRGVVRLGTTFGCPEHDACHGWTKQRRAKRRAERDAERARAAALTAQVEAVEALLPEWDAHSAELDKVGEHGTSIGIDDCIEDLRGRLSSPATQPKETT